MAGLYIHVPFCAKRCLYCDFFSNTEMKYKEAWLSSVQKEMELQKDYLNGEPLETIYLGGGTPSQLSAKDLESIFETIYRLFTIEDNPEITLEANPDDMSPEYVQSLRSLPVNRISMGVQSFQERDLQFLERRHNREQAIRAVSLCKENGFENISIDLIYGLPEQTMAEWEENLAEALRLDVPHISAYHLIYEEGTKLYKLKEAGKVREVDEELSISLFSRLIEEFATAGYLHYEISNFARPNMFSRHNTSYWTGKSYLGIGPSAHSYNQESRQWNVSSLIHYIKGIEAGQPDIEIEKLNICNKYNDYIITSLRTMWGVSLGYLLTKFGKTFQMYFLKQAASYIDDGLLLRKSDKVLLSPSGIFISDGIMSDLLCV
ncbi:putative oxygen-independent coproporphyrinogen III oxidase [Parabacteroides sp. PF5-5]|uniref:radical SAM family heme chaperone HemW n=1 Tax=unclassified Parabacteroides TaxID=2649774 RepID=UPI0024762860|nr:MULTISPECIES: radical SAM family heme chaperone HemW [unclassified Parabacteroides]MDH6305248.1 putative oxygen-independent coproporphyrinogen III oxidase [Parabacteroides sp. PH5-39]MDH6316601.1 putative oxygen-independent coproporphyrinogen III oxidase [Parabacteroides sp. PF5-13]MDH6320219.1 putative oxygen-independent coproporphyrinogen III oxidase [Parabacteroides sp. PH5-13]MDH6323838.1 putative oxygen-independent coproporphyrinogen III oxidase [Parabacteroides sp. PH5-8]MDH6327896.1 